MESEEVFKDGNIALSITMNNKIIEENPNNYVALSNRGTFKFNECESKRNLSSDEKISIYEDLKQSISICPEFSQGYRNLIAIAHEIEDFDTVIYYSRLYIRKFGSNKSLPNYGKTLSRYSFALHAKGEVSEAMKYSSIAIQSEPADNFAYIVRGKCYREGRQFDKAMADFDTAIKLDASSFLAYYERGYCLKMMNRYSEAQSHYLKAIEIDSNRAEAYFGIGVIKVEMGDTLSGCQYYYKALLMNRKGCKPISFIYEEIMQGEIEKICY